MNIIDHLKEKELCAQVSDSSQIQKLFLEKKIVAYLGIDPTAGSLHIGNLVPLRLLKVLVDFGQQCVILLGEGTTHVGDPSGKTTTRKLLTSNDIHSNCQKIEGQIRSLLNSWNCQVGFVNNAEWLLELNYVDFLRDIGTCFSINRMLSFESYKQRMERGLSFIEFNYQVMQAYDFYVLHKKHGINVQIGGDDQWGNMVSGIDLIRRKTGAATYALTAPLLTTASGGKMGKTEKGSVYLDPEITSAFEFFQYWRNIADADVKKLLMVYTDLDVQKIEELTAVEGSAINAAKKQLAYEVTSYVHGKEKAKEILDSTESYFEGRGSLAKSIPTHDVSLEYITDNPALISVFVDQNLCKSTSEARRFVSQGGLYVNDEKITDHTVKLDSSMIRDSEVHLRVGKKRILILKITTDYIAYE